MRFAVSALIFVLIALACKYKPVPSYDTVIRGGTIYDGSGHDPFVADIGINHDTITFIGDLSNETGRNEIDAEGLAVSPGFINMLSWAEKTLLIDGRSMSDIVQGVTLEVFGEGFSPGPIRRTKKEEGVDSLWTTLDGYFNWLMKKGVSPNVASFVGATSIRMHELDQDNRKPTPQELERMKALVDQAMQEGAMGLGTSLIYAPANFADTEELIELSKIVSKYGGMYITHLRSEGDYILNALDEAFTIGREAGVPVEIYHLKVNIPRNWNKIEKVLFKIDSAQKTGLKVTANMYPYTASATGLNSRMPTWVLEGGGREMRKRLKNREVRKKVLYEMAKGIPYKNSDPSAVVVSGFRSDSLNALYRGKRLDEVAKLHGKNEDETVLDLVIADQSRVEAIYYLQSEENVRKIVQLPYVSFGSDAGSLSLSPPFADWGAHPRAFGTFARIFAKYVREEKSVSLTEAIRRMTSLPATNLKIKDRGLLKPGYFADVVIFNPDTIQDHATFENPRQLSTGVKHVFVNGVQVISNGEHTGAKPGRIIRGPGYKPETTN